jgi:hypothetical protein
MVRWPIAVASSIYAVVVFVVFLMQGGLEGAGTFGVIVIVSVTVLAFAPNVSIFTGTRTWTLVATVLVVLLLAYFVVGLLLWFPVATGLIAASIAGPPVRGRRASIAAGDDRLDALD